ncbi:hypothetical protein LguiA_028103 [Lonicera macranthoides]
MEYPLLPSPLGNGPRSSGYGGLQFPYENPHSYGSKVLDSGTSQQENPATATSVHGLPLTPEEYRSFFEFRKGKSEKLKSYGALTFPRFEIFLIILALPCICQASAAIVKGGSSSGVITGILLLGVVYFLLLALFSFLSIGITFGKLLQYKEVHQEGKKFHWYQEIVRITLGPGKRGQWTWKNQSNSVFLAILGPLFEDLRGPPKYMRSQIAGGTHIRADL